MFTCFQMNMKPFNKAMENCILIEYNVKNVYKYY